MPKVKRFKKLRCPICGSLQVYWRKRDGMVVCRSDGRHVFKESEAIVESKPVARSAA